MHKFEKANFNIDQYDETENYGRFVIEPLERGFGTTLGNALRRVLLSSLPGSAVYAIKVQGAIHEFSAIDGVVEDVTTMILNLKKLVFDVDSEDTATMIIDVKGPATVTGADIQCPAEVKMISNDLVIAHVAEGGHLYMLKKIVDMYLQIKIKQILTLLVLFQQIQFSHQLKKLLTL